MGFAFVAGRAYFALGKFVLGKVALRDTRRIRLGTGFILGRTPSPLSIPSLAHFMPHLSNPLIPHLPRTILPPHERMTGMQLQKRRHSQLIFQELLSRARLRHYPGIGSVDRGRGIAGGKRVGVLGLWGHLAVVKVEACGVGGGYGADGGSAGTKEGRGGGD